MSTETAFYVTVHVKPDAVEEWLEASKPIFEKIKAEPAFMFFEMYKSPEEPGTISWVEKWSESLEWLTQNQITKDYYKEYFAATEHMYTAPRETKPLIPFGPPFVYSK